MRGNDGKQGDLFSYVSLESRVPRNHPLRKMREMVDEALEGMASDFDEMYSDGSPVDPSGAPAASPPDPGALQHPERADAHGAARLQPALPVVHWPGGGRRGLAPDHVHPESGAASGAGDLPEVLRTDPQAGQEEAAAIERALHGGRHVH